MLVPLVLQNLYEINANNERSALTQLPSGASTYYRAKRVCGSCNLQRAEGALQRERKRPLQHAMGAT